jgi:alpha 1,3-glucosidase
MMRPLFFEFPEDEAVFAMEDQFMVGPAILVKPVVKAGVTSLDVYLPGDQGWFDLEDGTPFRTQGTVNVAAPITKIPVFQKGGSIIPKRERARRSSALMNRDPITLVVALDPQGKASGELYLDDGETFAFLAGHSVHRSFDFSDGVLRNTAKTNAFLSEAAEVQIERIVIRGVSSAPHTVTKYTAGLADELSFVFDAAIGQLTIRKPVVSVAKDWRIVLA